MKVSDATARRRVEDSSPCASSSPLFLSLPHCRATSVSDAELNVVKGDHASVRVGIHDPFFPFPLPRTRVVSRYPIRDLRLLFKMGRCRRFFPPPPSHFIGQLGEMGD